MTPAVMLAAAALVYATGWAADRIERLRAARRPAAAPAAPSARRAPSAPRLTPVERSHLAALASRRRDPKAGRQLADYLRTRCPAVPDADLMRCVLALACAARHFGRRELTATDALAGYLRAMESAALDLTALDRDEIPR